MKIRPWQHYSVNWH